MELECSSWRSDPKRRDSVATNKRVGDNARKGAVKKRTQRRARQDSLDEARQSER